MPSKQKSTVPLQAPGKKTPGGSARPARNAGAHDRAADVLQDTHALLHAIVDSTSDMIWSVDPENFGLVTFNRSLRDYFFEQRGMEIKIGDRPEELFPPGEFVERWQSMYHRAFTQAPYQVEYRVFSGTRTLELHFNLLKRADKVFGISVFGQDITERKQAEEALRLSEEKWRSLVSASPDYIALHDPEGRYLFLNHYAEGFSEKEVIGASLYDYLLPESVPLYRSAMEKALQSWTIQHFEMNGLGDGGAARIYENYIVPLHGKDSEVYTLAIARDITERKQAEAALQASEEKLRTIFDTMSEGVALNQIVFDNNGEMVDYRILEINETFHQVADYEPGQVEGCTASQLYGMSLETIQNFWKSHKSSTKTAHAEFISPLSKRTYYISTSPFKDDTFVTTFVDITKLKQAERALKQSEEKFRVLTEKSGTGIYIIQDEKVVYINPKLEEMFGYPAEEILGRPIPRELIQPDDLQAVFGGIQQRLAGVVENNSVILKACKRDGSILDIEVYGMLIDYQGRPAIMGTVLDVTGRLQVETGLRLSEERLREVLDNSLDAAYKRNLITNGYEYFSPVITRLSGYSPEDMKSLPLETVLEMIHPEDVAEVNRQIAEAFSGAPGAAWQMEYRFKHKQGQYCWFQDRFCVMRDSSGTPVALIGSVSDITDRKQAEATLRQKVDELERFQRLTVGRELKMIEMKKEINALLAQAGLPEKYPLPG